MAEQSLSNDQLANGVDVEPGQAVSVVTDPPFDITKLPDVMDAQKDEPGGRPWKEGATLMRRWFNGPATGSEPDTTTITMNWILGYDRAKVAYDHVLNGQYYLKAQDPKNTPDVRNNIMKMFMIGGKVRLGKFGDLDKVSKALRNGDTAAIKASYINRMDCGSQMDPLDGLKAALGRWNFYIHVEGTVEEDEEQNAIQAFFRGKYKATITRVGVHVRDSFDFDGFQPLGCWNIKKKTVDYLMCDGGERVYNADFRKWREENNKGGDFLIYSDLLVTSVPSDRAYFYFDP